MKCIIINRKDIKSGGGIVQAIVDALPIQLHIPGYKYCGPGTKLSDNDPEPINRVDAICRAHDYEYKNSKNKEEIRQADCRMLDKLSNLKDLTWGEEIGRFVSSNGILMKLNSGSGCNKKKRKKKYGLSRNNRMSKK